MTDTQIKERPIDFSAEEVRATLDRGKTTFRRVVKFPGPVGASIGLDYVEMRDGTASFYSSPPSKFPESYRDEPGIACPYGKPGDRLWVREAWSASGSSTYWPRPCPDSTIWYRADNKRPTWASGAWRSPIQMPRWASRLTLEVKSVRVGRVQDITLADAVAEGVYRIDDHAEAVPWRAGGDHYGSTARAAFAKLWNTIKTKKGYDWDANPWVWVVEYERVEE